MTINEKYDRLRTIFYKDFIVVTKNCNCRGTNIPASMITKDEIGNKTMYFYDGTINMAEYLLLLYMEWLNGNEDAVCKIKWCLNSLRRLCRIPLEDERFKNPNVYFKEEFGFFVRDDVSSAATKMFDAYKISSGYSNGIELQEEDPCFSPFVSQDQIWNLAPILSLFISRPITPEIKILAENLVYDIFSYVIRNGHTIYNPYYSALKHHWSYLPSMNEKKVRPWERIEDRNRHLKYDVKVKRGANNWYFAYGFRKVFKKFFPKDRIGKWKSFWYGVIYYPLIFMADRVYYPIFTRFGVKRKDNSFYCLSAAGDVWYGSRRSFLKRVCKNFNKDVSYWNPALVECLKQGDFSYIDKVKLTKWLENYSFDEKSLESPVKFLTLYQLSYL